MLVNKRTYITSYESRKRYARISGAPKEFLFEEETIVLLLELLMGSPVLSDKIMYFIFDNNDEKYIMLRVVINRPKLTYNVGIGER